MELSQQCPICKRNQAQNSRYPHYLCKECASKTTDSTGQSVRFRNIDISGGLVGYYTSSDEEYPSSVCWVESVKCVAREHRMGGVVIEMDIRDSLLTEYKNEEVLTFRGDKQIYEQPVVDVIIRFYNQIPRKKDLRKEAVYNLNKRYAAETFVLSSEYEKNKNLEICPECGSYDLELSSIPQRHHAYCKFCEFLVPIELIKREKGISTVKAKAMWNLYIDDVLMMLEHENELPEQYVISQAQSYLRKNKFAALINLCRHFISLKYFPNSSELYLLLGLGLVNQGQTLKARECFLKSVMLSLPEKINSIAMVSYITSCFDTGDKMSGLKILEEYFEEIDRSDHFAIYDTINEGLKSGLIEASDISKKLREFLKL